jgi:hypothetical protein
MIGAVVGVLGGIVFPPSRLLRLVPIGWRDPRMVLFESPYAGRTSPHDYNSHPPLEGSFLRLRLDHKRSCDLVGLRYDRSNCIEESSSLLG